MSDRRPLSQSARDLGEILEAGGELADAIREAIHRTMLWRFTTGRRKPDADRIALLHRLSDGKVAADGWGDEQASKVA